METLAAYKRQELAEQLQSLSRGVREAREAGHSTSRMQGRGAQSVRKFLDRNGGAVIDLIGGEWRVFQRGRAESQVQKRLMESIVMLSTHL